MHKNSHSRRIYIHAAAALGPHGDILRTERRVLNGDPQPLELKQRVKEIVGVPLRQASHLVELAAIGSQLCLQRLTIPAPPETAVYVGTGLAEVRKNEAIFRQVMPPGPGMASPFDFINAANNMAAFYTAKLGNFHARNLTVSQEEFSFEWALQLAAADLRAGDYRRPPGMAEVRSAKPSVNESSFTGQTQERFSGQALVGGVDENSLPRINHLRRIALRDDQPMSEGSGWLMLSTSAQHAIGELIEIKRRARGTTTAQALLAALPMWRNAQEPVTLLPGLRIEPSEIEQLLQAVPGLQVQDYLAWCGAFHTAAACGIAALFDAPAVPGLFIHLNRDASGRSMFCAVRVF